MTRVSAVDVAWFHMEDAKSAADIVALLQLDGVLAEADARALLEVRLMAHPRFRERVVASGGLGTFEWREDAAASVDRHFARKRLPAPGGTAELMEEVNRLLNEPLDFGHSPWRVYLLDGSPQGSVLFAQLHHCLGDGFALIDTLLSLADEAARETPPAGRRAVRRSATWVAGAAALARRTPRALSDLLYLLRLPFDPPNPLRGRLAGQRRVAFSAPFELAQLKASAHARGATVNDLLLAAISGGIHHYSGERASLPPALRALVPVNLRAPARGTDPAHANWFGLVFVELPIAAADRETRLRRVKAGVDRIKASEQAAVSLAILAALGRMPRAIERFFERILARKASLVVSNVPGPREAFHLAGRRLRDVVFWVPHPGGLACGISILSYAGRIRIGVRSDAGVVTDPERLVQHIERELGAWDAPLTASPARLRDDRC